MYIALEILKIMTHELNKSTNYYIKEKTND